MIAVSPETSTTRTILGFDIGNDPVRGPVARAAMDSGTPQLSPPIELSTTGQPGFLVVAALYRHGEPVDSASQRRSAAVGFVSGAYVATDLIALVERQLPAGTALMIADGGVSIHGDSSSPADVTRQVALGGRTWTVGVAVPQESSFVAPIALLLVGMLLAGVVQLTIRLARRREQLLAVTDRRMRAEAQHADSLGALSESLLEAHGVPAVAATIMRSATDAAHANDARLGVLTDDGTTIEIFGRGAPEHADAPLTATTTIDADDEIARVTRSRNVEGGTVEPVDQLVVPLDVDGRPLGALCLDLDPPRSLVADELALVVDLAAAGARTLELARLFSEVDAARAIAVRERSRVESQRQLSVDLSRAATAEGAADIVLRRAMAVSSSVAGGVSLAHEDGYLEFVAVRGIADDDVDRMPTLAFDERSASSEAFRTGKESFAASAEEFQARYPEGYRISGGEGRGIWALPLVAQGSRIGAVVLILDTTHLPSDDDKRAVRALAAQVAQALRRARTSDRTRDASEELQRAMLPVELDALPGTSVTGLYRSATQILEIGGDWYDAVETGDDLITVAVGDVVGRGVSAAATMGQLRVAWRALARGSEGPGALLSALDLFARDLPGAEVSTVVCAQLDVTTGHLRYACAGHLPPLVLTRGGEGRFLMEGRSTPLATSEAHEREEGGSTVHAGDTVVLYSDGLVERRDETLDEGMERLRRAAEQVTCARVDLAEELAARLVDRDRSVDDVAILTLTLLPMFRLSIDRDPRALAPVRASLRGWLAEQGSSDEVIEEVVLASGEAIANAIEHAGAGGMIGFRAWCDDERIVLRVTDQGPWRAGEPTPDRGHGFSIMRALMDDVRVETDDRGTSVELSRANGSPSELGVISR